MNPYTEFRSHDTVYELELSRPAQAKKSHESFLFIVPTFIRVINCMVVQMKILILQNPMT